MMPPQQDDLFFPDAKWVLRCMMIHSQDMYRHVTLCALCCYKYLQLRLCKKSPSHKPPQGDNGRFLITVENSSKLVAVARKICFVNEDIPLAGLLDICSWMSKKSIKKSSIHLHSGPKNDYVHCDNDEPVYTAKTR